MNLETLKSIARNYIKAANANVINDITLVKILNEGALDIASKIGLLHKNIKFNVEEDTYEYTISTIASDFLKIDKSGLFWNSGTGSSPNWGDPLDAYTRENLNIDFPDWQSDSAGNPIRYFIESNSLFIHPTPDTDLTEGFWLYYIAKPEIMSNDSHYPFVTSVEVPQYTILHETILLYWRWKAYQILAKKEERIDAKKDYEEDLINKKTIIDQMPYL